MNQRHCRARSGLLGAATPIAVALCAILAGLSARPAWADPPKESNPPAADLTQMSLEELMQIQIPSVYGASKFEQKVTEAPAVVTIVTADQIKKFGYRTLADILASVMGLYTTYDRNYHYLGLRGFGRPGDYNSRVLLLVDGHRINENIYDQAPIGTEFPIDLDLIDHVEVIRGPSSSLYGTNAFLGVVNVVTRRAEQIGGTEASGAAGTFRTYNGRVSYGRNYSNDVALVLSASGYRSHGPSRLFFDDFNDPATNNGVARDNDDDRYHSVFLSLGVHDVTLQAAYSSREKGIPTAAFGTVFNTDESRTTDEWGYLDLKVRRRLGGRWEAIGRIYYDTYDYFGDYLFDYSGTGVPPFVLNKDVTHGRRLGSDLQISGTVARRQRLTAGLEYQDNLRQVQKNFDDAPRTVYLDDRRDTQNWGLYLQDAITVTDGLILNAGVRHDLYDTFGHTTNPRLALIYTPVPETTIKLLHGGAFRAPDAYELYYQDGVSQKPSPDLKPETTRTTEVVLEQALGRHVRALATGYYLVIHDLISLRTDLADGLLMFHNVYAVRATGVEAQIEGKWDRALELRASYSVQRSEDANTGDRLANSPQQLGKLNLLWPWIGDRLFSGIEVQYTARRLGVIGAEVPGFTVANATLFERGLIDGLEISASVYNLFDQSYGDPVSEAHRQNAIEQNGRTYRVKLTYRF